ncbi:MAG TPA: hypothetical protein VN794_18765 [Methylomirabilota bacterium]|nr:hypothetical protein [Methylomirabilota bacterium]
MPWGAAAAVAAAGIGYAGSQSAANKQAGAAGDASDMEWNMWQENLRREQPFIDTGTAANNALQSFLGLRPDGSINPNAPGMKSFSLSDFQADPGYQFRMSQGQDALLARRSALGGVQSGATLKDLTQFSQGLGSEEFMNAYNRFNMDQNTRFGRLSGTANTGANVAGGVAGLGANVASGIGQNLMGAGNASAAGIVGGANAINQGFGSAYNNYMQQQLLNSYRQQNPNGVNLNFADTGTGYGSGQYNDYGQAAA